MDNIKRAHFRRTFLGCLYLLIGPGMRESNAQQCPPEVLVPASHSADISMTYVVKGVTQCTIAPADKGTFVKRQQTGYKLHIDTWVTGACQSFIQNDFCDPAGPPDIRDLGVSTFFSSVDGLQGYVQPSTYTQSYSTYIAGQSTGPVNFFAGSVGERTITSDSETVQTACLFTPHHVPQDDTLVVNAMYCEPKWQKIGNPTNTHHLPAQTIELYVPPSMWSRMVGASWNGPAVQAANDWTTALTGLGPSVQVVSTPCSGGACVLMEEFAGSIPGCADYTGGVPNYSTGVMVTASTMRFPQATWQTASDARLRRSVGHELFHGFGGDGLHNTCTGMQSIHGTNPSCSNISGLSQEPTAQDSRQARTSPYGNGQEKVCGF
jgi:hypothetical protein